MSLENNNLYKSAIEYAEMGWYVFPVHFVTTKQECSCGNSDCTSIGKHPIVANGLNEATTDKNIIANWWRKTPYANIGIRTGDVSGFDAIDIDPRHLGDETWEWVEAEFGKLPETPIAITGGGGTHILITHTEKIHSQNNILNGIDVKANGGYILVEPSNHLSGRNYEWELSAQPTQIPMADLRISAQGVYNLLVESQERGETITQEELPESITAPVSEQMAGTTTIGEGSRNSQLTSVAGSLRRRGLGSDEIALIIHQYNSRFCDPPLEAVEVDRIAHGMMRYQPDPLPPSTITPSNENDQRAVSVLPLTDGGNRDRLINRYGRQILYVPEQGWRIWDDVRWCTDSSSRVTEMALNTARVIRAEEQTGVIDRNGVDRAEKWSFTSEGLQKIKAMIQLAQSHPNIVCSVNELDTHQYLFNATNTTIDLLTGEPIDPDPVHRLTQISNMKFEPNEECPKWNEFLSQILPDPNVVKHLQRFLGLSLSGDMTAEAMFILFGEGANGKSILLEVLAHLMGDYLSNAPAHTFLTSSRNEAIRNDLAMLRSARLVTVSETNKGSMLDESVIKRTVSGDQETARFLHKEFFTFKPQYKILLATNNKPEIQGGTHGTWRRLHLIEFGVKFGTEGHPKAGKKDEIVANLKAEASGILNWLIKGFQDYRIHGLEQPQAVSDATRSYREDQDPLIDFISSCCNLDNDLTIPTSDLREAYNEYTGDDKNAVWFGRTMSEHGYKVSRTGSVRMRVYKGISLNEEGQMLLTRNNRGFEV